MNLEAELERLLGARPQGIAPLSGGCVGELYLAELADGRVVCKVDRGEQGRLEVEGAMLRYLREHTRLPVPEVLHAAPELLVLEWLPGGNGAGGDAEVHAAELLRALHAHTPRTCGHERDAYGFPFDTLIGGLHLPNPWTSSWLEFFGQQRLVEFGRVLHDQGRIDARCTAQLDRLANKLTTYLDEPARPCLLHGDVWSGNVLSAAGRVTGFVDPALHFGHPEVELAFITMFDTFGARFFEAYGAVDDDFFAVRRHVYNLHPLLVHSILFGGGYVGGVHATLDRFAG